MSDPVSPRNIFLLILKTLNLKNAISEPASAKQSTE
jgi:hypothetical protein